MYIYVSLGLPWKDHNTGEKNGVASQKVAAAG